MFLRKLGLVATTTIALCAGSAIAQAETITFDDIKTSSPSNLVTIADGYAGFNWDNFYALNPVKNNYPASNPYVVGMVSGPIVAFTAAGLTATLESVGGLFDLASFYATSVATIFDTLYVTGYSHGAEKYYGEFAVVSSRATLVSLNWTGIDAVSISSFGNAQIAIDNITVPGPVAGAGLPVLLGLIGFNAWRRRRHAA